MLKANLVLVTGIMLASVSAFAAPKLGQTAVANITVTQGAQVTKGSLTLAITKIDEAQKLYLLSRAQKVDGQEEKKDEEWKSEDEIGGSDAQIADALANCASQGGTLEKVTVAAGAFDACTLPLQDDAGKPNGKVSVAKVPFGVVRLEQQVQEGVKLVVELASFSAGN